MYVRGVGSIHPLRSWCTGTGCGSPRPSRRRRCRALRTSENSYSTHHGEYGATSAGGEATSAPSGVRHLPPRANVASSWVFTYPILPGGLSGRGNCQCSSPGGLRNSFKEGSSSPMAARQSKAAVTSEAPTAKNTTTRLVLTFLLTFSSLSNKLRQSLNTREPAASRLQRSRRAWVKLGKT
jgi:hypothetical protein